MTTHTPPTTTVQTAELLLETMRRHCQAAAAMAHAFRHADPLGRAGPRRQAWWRLSAHQAAAERAVERAEASLEAMRGIHQHGIVQQHLAEVRACLAEVCSSCDAIREVS